MNATVALILAATLTFSPFAGIIAYIVTLDEYERHFEKKQARRQALDAALFTFIIFIIVGLVSGYVFNTFIIQH
ncbi:MAG: hypothetical protein ACREHC_02575 [Candidatus Levyibacteriota bacterium]